MATEEQLSGISGQHKQVWERLFSLLRSSKAGSTEACHKLAELPAAERMVFVEQTWGRGAIHKVQPILLQIATLEEQAGRITSAEKPKT